MPASAATQLGFDGMPRQLFSATPAKLSSFMDCPRRYRMTYLDRPSPARGGPWAHLSVGAALHLALRSWWLLPEQRRGPEVAETLLNSAWISQGFRDADQERETKQLAQQWLASYFVTLAGTDEPIGIERTVAFRSSVLAFSGRADRIDVRPASALVEPDEEETEEVPSSDGPDQLVIVDYKTGRTPLTGDDARGSAALAMYALAARRTLRRECFRVELHHLPTESVTAHTHTPASLRRHLDRAEAVAGDISSATQRLRAEGDPDVFPAQPSRLCGWCDFRAHCPEGQRASEQQEPWAGLPTG